MGRGEVLSSLKHGDADVGGAGAKGCREAAQRTSMGPAASACSRPMWTHEEAHGIQIWLMGRIGGGGMGDPGAEGAFQCGDPEWKVARARGD